MTGQSPRILPKVVELPYKCSAVYENRMYGAMRGARIFILPLLYYDIMKAVIITNGIDC